MHNLVWRSIVSPIPCIIAETPVSSNGCSDLYACSFGIPGTKSTWIVVFKLGMTSGKGWVKGSTGVESAEITPRHIYER